MSATQAAPGAYTVDLPVGGKLYLRSQEEVDLWEELAEKYQHDYALNKANDLALLGAVLSQHLTLFRAQQMLNGMVVELDAADVPTGRYKLDPDISSADRTSAQTAVTKASVEIREIEKSLGIDKKTREAGGQYNVSDYIVTLKKVAHRMGVHIAGRVLLYEEFGKEVSWMIRLLRNGDDEDRKYHNVTEDSIMDFIESKLAEIDAYEKAHAHEQSTFLGKL